MTYNIIMYNLYVLYSSVQKVLSCPLLFIFCFQEIKIFLVIFKVVFQCKLLFHSLSVPSFYLSLLFVGFFCLFVFS